MRIHKIGITGNKGFIGSHLAQRLRKENNLKVAGFDLPANLLNPAAVSRFVKNKDIIIHAAGVNRGTDFEIIKGNLVATYNLLTAISRLKKKPKIIFLSSIHASGDTVFGLAKRLTEIMLTDFSSRQKTPVTIFRFTNIFGEKCRPFYNSVVATFCQQAAGNKPLSVKNGNNKIRLLYVGDVIKIIQKEIRNKKSGFKFKIVSSSNEIQILKLAKLIKSFKNLKNHSTLKPKFHKDLYRTYLSYVRKH